MEKTIDAQRLITADEFEHFITQPENSDRRLELIHGEIVEKVTPTEEHGEIAINIAVSFRLYLQTNKAGRVSVETRHRTPEDRLNDRIPDLSVMLGRRPVVKEGAVPRMPDLAVEIRSPGDSWGALHEKAGYYLAHGTQMVILVDPLKRRVIVRTQGGETAWYEKDVLDLGPVLPGLTIAVKDIFADPLADDAGTEEA